MTKKLGWGLLAILTVLCIFLSAQIGSLQAKLEVRESAIENLANETGVELIREFRQAVEQVKKSKATMSRICKEGKTVLPAKDFNFYCG